MREATSVAVRGMGVCEAGPRDALAAALPALRSLDMAECLLSDVREVLAVIAALPQLRMLDMSGNLLDYGGADGAEDAGCGDAGGYGDAATASSLAMRVLVLNRCNVAWARVLALCRACPRLEELRLHRAGLRSLCAPPALASLRVLDLDGNSLAWPAPLAALGALPALEVLFVGHNSIEEIRLPNRGGDGVSDGVSVGVTPASPAAPAFPRLDTLSLSGNPLADWRSISELHALPSLRSLRVIDVPLMEDATPVSAVVGDGGGGVAADEPDSAASRGAESNPCRDAVIARLGGLQVLDGSTVHADERLHAEKCYLNSVVPLIPGATVPPAVLDEHPRVPALLKMYDVSLGAPSSSSSAAATKVVRRKTLRGDLVHCSFVNCGGLGDCAVEAARLELPSAITVGRLSGLAARLFGRVSAADVAWIQLVDNAGVAEERVVVLDDEARDLRHYGVEGGQAVCFKVRGRFGHSV